MSNAASIVSNGASPSANRRRWIQESFPTNLFGLTEQGNYQAILNILADERRTQSLDIHACTRNGDTALHIAASRGHLKVVIVLLGAGAKVDAPGHIMRTPLHCAADQGHLLIVQRLLDAGAQIDAKDASGETALDVAKDAKVMLLLVRMGAKLNERTLCVAVSQGNKSLFELCLQKGVSNMDISNKEGDTLVVLGVKGRRWEMVELLLEKGASATKCKSLGECPLVLAAKDGQGKIVRELLIRGANKVPAQMKNAFIAAKSAAVVWAFVREVPDVVRGEIGKLGFLSAAEEGRLEPLEALLEAGVDINGRNNNSQTALHLAAQNGHNECLQQLIKRRPEVDAVDNRGNTPLHKACMGGRVECVLVLLMAGASTTARNKSNKSPLQVATTDAVRSVIEPFSPKRRRTSGKPLDMSLGSQAN